jgi:parallel beta-helix repeat protein
MVKMGNRILILLITFTLILTINIMITNDICKAENNIIYVDKSGDSDYTNIQDAIDSANESDTIYVYAGDYYENIIINKSINLKGAGFGYTYIFGDSSDHTIKILSDEVEISGFYIQNERVSYSCIFLKSISDCIIRNNIISKSGNGIYIINSKENIIDNNLIEKNNIGIYLSNSDINYIKSNVIKNNNANGILINSESNSNIIYLNHFSNNIVNNARDLNSNNWNRNAYGNFWDDYNDYDNNKDGIGDNPYVIDSNSKDYYPLGYFLSSINNDNDDIDPENNFTEDMLDDLFNDTNIIPIAKILKINPSILDYGQTATFEGLGKDSDGFISEYLWKSNIDGTLSRESIFKISSLSVGKHDITFKVKDNYGDWSNEAKSIITINQEAKPINILPVVDTGGPYYGFIDEFIEFDGTKSSDPDGNEIITYLWDFNDGETGEGEKILHSFNKSGNYTIKLTVTDINGGSSYKTSFAVINEKINKDITNDDEKNNISLPYPYIILIIIILPIILIIFKIKHSNKE